MKCTNKLETQNLCIIWNITLNFGQNKMVQFIVNWAQDATLLLLKYRKPGFQWVPKPNLLDCHSKKHDMKCNQKPQSSEPNSAAGLWMTLFPLGDSPGSQCTPLPSSKRCRGRFTATHSKLITANRIEMKETRQRGRWVSCIVCGKCAGIYTHLCHCLKEHCLPYTLSYSSYSNCCGPMLTT